MATGRLLKKDFELFKKEALRWVDILGLKDWEWHFIFGDCDKSNRAEYLTNKSGRMVTIWLSDHWKDDKSPREIKKTAFHEVAEIMLQNLRQLAMRDSSYEVVDEATHKVIRILENVLFPKY